MNHKARALEALKKMRPMAYRFDAPGITKLDNAPHGGAWITLYSAEQLAFALSSAAPAETAVDEKVERQAFERAALRMEGRYFNTSFQYRDESWLSRLPSGDYSAHAVDSAWQGWKARVAAQPEERAETAVTCGNGCSCLTQCGDTYDFAGKPRPPKAGVPVAEPVALTGEREAELWMAGFRAAETRRAGNLDENTQVVTVQAHNNALRRLMTSLRQPVNPSEIVRPYGMCSITGPAEDVEFMLRHLPDIDAAPSAPEGDQS